MKKTKPQAILLGFGLLVAVLAMTGCEHKSISEILANPSEYAGKDISIMGSVTRSFSLLGRGAYEVNDGTGKLWIVSDRGVPREGARVVVKGIVQDGFNLSSLVKLPEAFSAGLVMIEKEHRSR